MKNHLSETACPRFAAEAIPPKFFHFKKWVSGSIARKVDAFIRNVCRRYAENGGKCD